MWKCYSVVSFRENYTYEYITYEYITLDISKILSPVGLRKKTEADATSAPEVAGKSLRGGPPLHFYTETTLLITFILHFFTLFINKTSQELGICPMGQREALLKERLYWKHRKNCETALWAKKDFI